MAASLQKLALQDLINDVANSSPTYPTFSTVLAKSGHSERQKARPDTEGVGKQFRSARRQARWLRSRLVANFRGLSSRAVKQLSRTRRRDADSAARSQIRNVEDTLDLRGFHRRMKRLSFASNDG